MKYRNNMNWKKVQIEKKIESNTPEKMSKALNSLVKKTNKEKLGIYHRKCKELGIENPALLTLYFSHTENKTFMYHTDFMNFITRDLGYTFAEGAIIFEFEYKIQ